MINLDLVRLRPAVPEDAEAGALLHNACWREAYGPYADPERLAARLADADRWRESWARQVGGSRLGNTGALRFPIRFTAGVRA